MTSQPEKDAHATPICVSVITTASELNRSIRRKAAEIPVQGNWTLHIVVKGTAGQGIAEILLMSAVALLAIPI